MVALVRNIFGNVCFLVVSWLRINESVGVLLALWCILWLSVILARLALALRDTAYVSEKCPILDPDL